MMKLSNKSNFTTQSIFILIGLLLVNAYIIYSIISMIYVNPYNVFSFASIVLWGMFSSFVIELMYGADATFSDGSYIHFFQWALIMLPSIILLNVFAWYASKLAFKVYSAIRKK
jgi:hypothetical protein